MGAMYFCLHCFAGKEKESKRLIEELLTKVGTEEFDVWFPTRDVKLKKRGQYVNAVKAMFDGYLFIFWNGDDETLFPFKDITRIPGVIRFLTYDNGQKSLVGKDLNFINWIHTNNGHIKESKVLVTEGKKVHFVEGPLIGFDGNVIKVDKHHKKVVVRFEIGTQVTDVSFSADFVERNITITSLTD